MKKRKKKMNINYILFHLLEMRRTRSRKTHKHHAKRHTRRRGGNGNGPSAAANTTPRVPIKLPNELPPGMPPGKRPPLNVRNMPVFHVPKNKYGRPNSYFKLPKNKGFKPAPILSLPGAPAAAAPSGIAPLARQVANNKAVPFALPGAPAALNGPAGAPLARQNAMPVAANNRKKVTTKVMPEGSPGSPFF